MKLSNKFPFPRRATMAKLAALFLLVATNVAFAQSSGGWSRALNGVGDAAQVGITVLVILCALAGVGAVGYGGKLLLKKSGERGDDVEWGKIGLAVVAGAFFLSISYIAVMTVETMGGSAADIGKKITIPR